jgi:hypothetical protein
MQHTHGSGVAWADAESNGRLVLLHGWLFFKRNLVLDGLKLGPTEVLGLNLRRN